MAILLNGDGCWILIDEAVKCSEPYELRCLTAHVVKALRMSSDSASA